MELVSYVVSTTEIRNFERKNIGEVFMICGAGTFPIDRHFLKKLKKKVQFVSSSAFVKHHSKNKNS